MFRHRLLMVLLLACPPCICSRQRLRPGTA